MPALHRLTSQETYYCQICLNNCPSTDGFPLSTCGHTFCRDCIKGYVELKVQEAAVRSLLCPFLPSASGGGEPPSAGLDSGCAREVADADVEALGGEALLEKLRRFRAMRQDETYRECPQCATQVPGGSARNPSMMCSQCGLTFCFVHSNAHPGQSCRQYEFSQRLHTLRGTLAVARVARTCPGCGARIVKDGGCNHMTCAYCRANFCWLCGRQMHGSAGVQRHYAGWNVFGCPGLQMEDSLGRCPPWCLSPCICCFRIFMPVYHGVALFVATLVWAVWPVLWLALNLLLLVYCIFWCPARCCRLGWPKPGQMSCEFWNLVCQGCHECDSSDCECGCCKECFDSD